MKLRLSVSGVIEINVDQVDDHGVASSGPALSLDLSSLFGPPKPAVDETIAAVITSAVATALRGRKFRIQSIQMVASAPQWGHAGRQTIHASHVLERKSR